ncbi:hypothetical protein KDL45_01050, partial [bacterium]|nr:hypothetical protein [bacterium]
MPADDPKTYTLAEELFELCRVLTAAYPQVRCAALGRMLAEDFWPEADGSDEDDGPWSEAESEGGAITPILDALAAWRERRDAAATAWGLP